PLADRRPFMAVKHLVDNVRDIALVRHRAAGKTSLADALLFEAHAVDRLGSVDDGTTNGDPDEHERRHHFSIDTHPLHADPFGKNCVLFNVPDTVGPDFGKVICLLDPPDNLPKTCPVDAAAARQQLIDAVVEADEALMEKYLTDGDVSVAELEADITKALDAG